MLVANDLGVRVCPRCDTLKAEEEFYDNRPECKDCKKKQVNERYTITSEERVVYSKERRNSMKLRAIKYKGGSCTDCGEAYHQACFDFHHIDPKEKEFNPGEKMSASWDTLKPELDKCVLLCSNCHRIRHFR